MNEKSWREPAKGAFLSQTAKSLSNNYKTRHCCITILIAIFLLVVIPVCQAASATKQVLVLYPEAEGGYAKIFSQIIRGIKTHPELTIRLFRIENGTTTNDVDRSLKSVVTDAVIVLGQKSYRVTNDLTTDVPLIAGAMVSASDNYSLVSLAGDPDVFFTTLKTLAPNVKRVSIVYNEINSGWLVNLAQLSASKHRLELKAYPAEDASQAAQHYRTILETSQNGTDSIWLPMDRVIPDKTILPITLDVAWKNNLVVFGSNPSYAKRGALFSLYPDHHKMGLELAKLALSATRKGYQTKIVPTRELKLLVNQRTASHLDLHVMQGQQRNFDLTYPSPR